VEVLPRPSQILAVAVTALLATADLNAQTRRGLVIGINRYETTAPSRAPATTPGSERGRITNLGGAVNDATAIRDFLQARFAFQPRNIALLTDQQATREGILRAIERLIAESARGDVVVFYYAGHGSQRRNSLSPEPSKLDQTLVPADANAGVFDVRDKELARAFNRLVDKGVELTLIFDSCHSGSIMRGGLAAQGSEVRERWGPIDPRDAADPGVEQPPEARPNGALVISAAQDYQSAMEMRDANNQRHGIFTSALIATLQSVPLTESATDVSRRVKARMQMNGQLQEPVLAGPADRLQRPLLGGAAVARGRTAVAVLRVDASDAVVLQGGPALGIREGAVLRKIGTTTADSSVRLEVDSVIGVSQVRARVTAGARDRVATGDLFELERWVAPANAGLSVALVGSGPDAATLQSIAAEIAQLRGSASIEWLDDPTTAPADSSAMYVMQWSGTTWELRPHAGAPIALPRSPTAAAVRAALAQRGHQRVRFFLSLPPTPQVAAQVRTAVGGGSSVSLVNETGGATYVLVGRAAADGLQYALIQPNASRPMADASPLPLRTEWVAASTAAARLTEHAFTLAKVRSWLLLEAPPNEGAFPYRLAFRRLSDGALRSEGPFVGGEQYEIVLVANSARITERVERRRVYIFVIDSDGNGELIFPSSNVENRVPFERQQDGRWPAEIALGAQSRFTVGAPFGTDTWILLAADETIEPWAFQWTGVSSGVRGAPGSLSNLLSSASGRTRGAKRAAPMNWSIERALIRSQASR
jgi:hypothetical protein